MTQKQWKQNQRIQNQKIYNRRIKKAFLPVTSGLLALMVMVAAAHCPAIQDRILRPRQLQTPMNLRWLDYTCIANQGSQEKIYVILKKLPRRLLEKR